jgi:hypothetical protein
MHHAVRRPHDIGLMQNITRNFPKKLALIFVIPIKQMGLVRKVKYGYVTWTISGLGLSNS